jgi:hypothetical protein
LIQWLDTLGLWTIELVRQIAGKVGLAAQIGQ